MEKYCDEKILVMKKLSSNIDEVIRVVLKSLFIYLFIFTKNFYTHRKYRKQTSDFHTDVFIRLKSIKK